MAGLDSRLSVAYPLQQLFRDKDTGSPLRSGVLKFFEDCSHTTAKDVYKITGSPGAYTYVSLGDEVTLNSAGMTDDIIYYFPFQGTPDDSDGTLDLYYVEIYSSVGVLQNTRIAVPNAFAEGSDDNSANIENFVYNGQFIAHVDIKDDGKITADSTNVAYGGWTFERGPSSDHTDLVTFNRDATFSDDDPERSPRYRVKVEGGTGTSTDTVKDLRIKWKDVNKFGTSGDQEFTFKFNARNLSAGTFPISVYLIKNFGTGGSPDSQTEVPIGSAQTLTTSWQDFYIQFSFGDNSLANIGTNDDDYVALSVRFPENSPFEAELTDFVLAQGDISNPDYPYRTDEQDMAVSISGSMPYPAHDGSDLYLPIRLGPAGLQYDNSMVSNVVWSSRASTDVDEVRCDGSTFFNNERNTSGVPYSRCGARLRVDQSNIHKFGTGRQFIDAFSQSTNSPYFYFHTNFVGSVTASADTGSTGFTFLTAHTGASYNVTSFRYASPTNELHVLNASIGASLAAPADGAAPTGFGLTVERTGTSLLKELFKIDCGIPPNSSYFTWSNTSTNFYVWFSVDGGGVDPTPGGTGIKLEIRSTDAASEIAQKLCKALSGFQITQVLPVAATSLNNKYWEFSTYVPTTFYVWYNVDSAGVDPALSGKTGIEIALTVSDTAATVQSKTISALNVFAWGTPDLRGRFIRSYDNSGGHDPDTNNRFQLNRVSANGDLIGTIQLDQNQSHTHTIQATTTLNTEATIAYDPISLGATASGAINYDGGRQSNPENVYLNAIMKI